MSDNNEFLVSIDKRLISLSKEVSGINKGLAVLTRIEGTQMSFSSDLSKLETRLELLEHSIEPVKLLKRVAKTTLIVVFTAFITALVTGFVNKSTGVDNDKSSDRRASSVVTREAPVPEGK